MLLPKTAVLLLALGTLLSITGNVDGTASRSWKPLGATLKPGDIPTPEVYYFDQTIDHFNFRTSGIGRQQTFKQRYLVYEGAWQKSNPNAPVFFYTGNEGDITSFWDNTGFVFDIAPKFGALVIFAEHRYYGTSLPFGNDSWTGNNIGYLSIEQALADYAQLLTVVKASYSIPNAPVISFGGSYGGILSAYFRIKYPHIVKGALAASAPIPVSAGYPSIPGYFQTVTNDFAAANAACPNLVRQGFSKLLTLAQQGSSGLATLSSAFKLCKPLSNQNDVEHLILWIVNSFGTLAMMDYPYATDFEAPLPGFPVKEACTLLMSANDVLVGLGAAAGLFYNGTTGQLKCFDIYSEFVECADQTGCGTGPSGQSWDYQVCTEVIYYPNTNNVTDMFPPRVWGPSDRAAYCARTWGVIPRPTWLGIQNGVYNIQAATNIIFSNGLLDPWHGGGYLQALSPLLPAVIIPDGAHHLDLRGSNPHDPPSVVAARKQEVDYIALFLAEP